MFSQIFFLITLLLIISFSPINPGNPWIPSPSSAFFLGLGAYLFVLSLIAALNRSLAKRLRQPHPLLLTFANVLLIIFFLVYHFILTAQRAFPNSSFLIAAFSLSLYCAALYIFYLTAYPCIPAGSRGVVSSASAYASNQVRFILPFSIPFLFLCLIVDSLTQLPPTYKEWMLTRLNSPAGSALVLGMVAVLMLLILLFYPPLAVNIWRCRDLSPGPLREKLEDLCAQAHFTHAGIKLWTILNHSYTAAVIGILPQFRYVLFTRRMIDDLQPRAASAVLAHEIGHSKHKHLLIYPLIILGSVVLSWIFSRYFGPAISSWFATQNDLPAASPIWKIAYPLVHLMIYTLIFLFYFRIVLGYFSRLFERQADLHIYALHIPADDMQLALDTIGHATGGTHQTPCWHHHSIQERIDFLEKTKNNPALIEKHHRRVRRSLIAYLILLGLGLALVFP